MSVSRILKATSLFFISCAMCVQAETVSSQSIRVTLNKDNVRLENILNEIEQQTNLLFIYNKNVNVNRKVSVQADNSSLEDVLKNLLGDDVSFKIQGTYIVLSPAGIPAPQQAKHTVSGVVSDALGPVAGANIVEKGTTNGTITDMNGNFTLEVASNATLVISYIGYKEQEIAVNGQKTVNVTLTEDSEALDEVVVIGYGTVKKSDLTGSVGSIQADKIEGLSIKSVDQMLQGRTSGLYMVQNSGMPGASSTVRIRGGNSISGGNEPLYIIYLKRMLQSPALDEARKSSLDFKLKLASRNLPGAKASDFTYYLPNGQARTLQETNVKNNRLLLVFYDPECPGCHEIMQEMIHDTALADAVGTGQLTVLAIYTEGNPEAWENDLSSIPSGWLAGTDREAIKLGALYDLKAMPSLYLLDGEKRVLLKDAPYSRIRAELGL